MSTSQFFQVLHREPTVVYAKTPWEPQFASALESPQPLAVLASTNWKLYPRDIEYATKWALEHQCSHPNHYIEFLLDRPQELDAFLSSGLSASPFQPNALCDERVYRPLDCPKEYAAIYIARPIARKRLDLCSHIRGKWLWLTMESFKDETKAYTESILRFENVVAPQFKNGSFTGAIPRDKVPSWIQRSTCGLSLSEREGSNYASTEYLLCGVPVVATSGDCTRNQLFDPSTTELVSFDAISVADSVASVSSKFSGVSPEVIRSTTLEKMLPHRQVFIDAVRRAYSFVGIGHDPAYDLYHTFRHQMLIWQPVAGVLQGGNEANRELLRVAASEPKTRKLWVDVAGSFWEKQLPSPKP